MKRLCFVFFAAALLGRRLAKLRQRAVHRLDHRAGLAQRQVME